MALPAATACLVLGLLHGAAAQQAGSLKSEHHVPLPIATCTEGSGCDPRQYAVTLDSQWRWVHDARPSMYGNCMKGRQWNAELVTDAVQGAEGCALEGISLEEYKKTYGVSAIPGGVKLMYKTGESVGSRLYVMENEDHYKMFKLLNKEFTFDVEGASLDCGMNGALYFVEMDEDGGKARNGHNTAGAKFGTGYCDAQCPRHLKFINGEANVKGWNVESPEGKYGACCSEMDIWEGNRASTAFTAHPCKTKGIKRCEGLIECGEIPPDCTCCEYEGCACCHRYHGVCDKDGCDYNPYRLGNQTFFGVGKGFDVDTTRPFTVITQFVTSDNTDTGDLVEIRRVYKQDGKIFKNPETQNLEGFKGDSITDQLCAAEKKTFEDIQDFAPKGGLKALGEALKRGVVLVLSLWDDELTHMDWLDSARPTKKHPLSKPGTLRGPCSTNSGDPVALRKGHDKAFVKYTNIKVGDIGSTYTHPALQPKVVEVPAPPPKVIEVPAAPLPDIIHRATPPPRTVAGAVCCTYSWDKTRPCETCGPGSADTTGYCAMSQGTCKNCLGTWCPVGVTLG